MHDMGYSTCDSAHGVEGKGKARFGTRCQFPNPFGVAPSLPSHCTALRREGEVGGGGVTL